MKDMQACAACLATDVRMFSMNSYSLLQPYQLLSGKEITEDMPQELCWECAALVNKFNLFRNKCERAHLLLQDIFCLDDETYHKNFRKIDRQTFNLISSYSTHSVDPVTLDPLTESIEEEKYQKDEPEFSADNVEYAIEIKKEETVEMDNDEIFYDIDSEIKFEAPIQRKRKKVEKKEKAVKKATKIKTRLKVKHKIIKKQIEEPPIKIVKKKRQPRKSAVPKVKKEKKVELNKDGTVKIRRQPNQKIDTRPYATEVILTQEQQMEEIRKRQDTASYKEARFKCGQCFKGCTDEKTYKNHLLKHDPVSGKYQCDVCKNRYKERRHVVNHIYKVHMSKLLCKFCTFVSQSPEQARNHNRWHTGVTYTCKHCAETFTKRSTHLSHLRIKHPTQNICGLCGESFVSERGLLQHNGLMHRDANSAPDATPGPFCAPCGVQFTTTAAWQKHVLISPQHVDERQFLPNGCRDCGENLPSEEALRVHQRVHMKQRRRVFKNESGDMKYPIQCAHCPVMIGSAREYWHHFRKAHPDQKYPAQTSVICEYCGKGFQNNALLVYHRHKHTGKRSYQCTLCPKSFFTPTALNTHLRSHDESRPHVCPICRKGFKVKPALYRHARIHTGEKPYICDVCGKAFTDSSSRNLHVRTVHLKEPQHRAKREPKKPSVHPQFTI